jgi:YegS/Rv2252/BmrU family lipid kinase
MLPAMPGTVVVVNPHSAGRKTEKRWPQLREIIHEVYGPFEVRFTDKPGSATTLTREALKSGAELVVAMGGDGTINEVVNGFFDGTRAIAPSAAFGVLPAGTGGDFVKSLGTSRDIRTAADALRRATARAIDVGRLTFVGNDGSQQIRHFINVASFGIGGLVDKYVNESSKALGGTLSFALATLKAGLDYKNANVRVVIDGAPPREGRIYNIAVANGRYFGGGMMIAPDARIDDGLFDVITLGDFQFTDLLLRGLDVYTGKHLKNPKVTVHRARRVEASATNGEPVLLDVDGEAPGRLPATFEVVPGGLRIRA